MPTIAESFGSDAERYDRTRPAYPGALVADVLAAAPGRAVLDVGCGTGIAARQFQAAGCAVLGVEPDERMARFARRTIEVEVATFEDWEPGDRRFDVVLAGQAWHWVDPVAGPRQAARALRPGGTLAVFWHEFIPPAEVGDPLAAAYSRVCPDSPFDFRQVAKQGYQPLADKAAAEIHATGAFAVPEHRKYAWHRVYRRDEWLDLVPTWGAFTQLEPGKLTTVLNEAGSAIDDLGGEFTMHYTTRAVLAVRGGTA